MSDVNVAVVYGANGLEFTKTEQTLPLTLNVVANGIVGPAGPTGATGATGATGPAGPAPAGTGLVSVTGGVLDTPSTLSARVAADAANLRTQLGLGTVATQDANNVTLTGGTLQGIGVVTGSYTSNVNEALLRSCRKASAGTITKGQVVYITGSTGSHLEIELADADTEPTSSKTFGVAAETITASTEGYVIVEGLLTGLSNLPTASFANGDTLWLSSTAGGWQTTPPADPANGVYLGRVINASNGNNGSAFIKIQNGYELDELHDVAISTPLDTHALYYEQSTQLWKNRAAVDADLAAVTVFPRFDADQSATATQKRTARRNIGFSDSFTTAELLALSATESAKLRVAYCSDCFSTSPDSASGYGDLAIWMSGQNRWITLHDKAPVTSDFLIWSLHLCRRDPGQISAPFCTVAGETPNNLATISGFTTGTGAFVDTVSSSSEAMNLHSSSVAALNSAVRAAPIFRSNAAFGTSPQRALAIVMSMVSNAAAVSNATDRWQWRVGVETYQASAVASAQADMISLVMDDYNSLGYGVANSNLHAVLRANSTTLQTVDTGLSAASNGFLIATWEPVGPAAGYGRARIATASNYGLTITTHVDQLVTLATTTNLQQVLCGVKNLGTGSRLTSRKWIRSIALTTNNNAGSISVS